MKKRILAATAIGIAAAIAITGCTNPGNENSNKGGDVLTIGMPNGTQTDNSNPFSNTSSAMSLGYAFAIYEPLLQVNPVDPAQAPVPWLATDYKWNDDYTEVTFTARDGVKWSDGKDFTAEDIAYSVNIRQDNPALNTSALPYDEVTVDGKKVTISFTAGQYVNQNKVLNLFIVPEHIWKDVADPATDLNQDPIGTGPYVLKSWTPQAATLTARTDYWGGVPAAPELRYSSYNDNNALTTALTTGEAQWGWTFIADYQNVYIAKDPEHFNFYGPAGLGPDILFLNTATKPFDDVVFRRALNMVVDRNAVAAQAMSGVWPVLENVTSLPLPAGDSFLASEFKDDDYSVDVDAAKALLADGGYTWSGDALIDPSGTPVTFTLTNPAGWNDYLTALQLVADAAGKLGAVTTVDAANQDAWFTNIANGDFQASMHWVDSGATPWDMYSNVMDGAQLFPIGEKANWNFGRFDNADVTDALKTFATTDDDAARQAAIETVQQVWVDQVPALGMVGRGPGAQYSTQSYTGFPSADDPYNSPQPTGPQASQILMKLKPAGK